MITNILDQSFADFAKQAKTVLSSDEEKAVVSPQRQRLDTLASYYTNRVSANETQLITKYADSLVSGGQPRLPDPRLYMRRDLLGLVQDSYALGIADALQDLEDVQFFALQTDADFAVSPDDKLQRDIAKLQRDIQASQQIVRQTKTLNQYTNTLQTLQQQAQALNNTQAIETLSSLSQQLDLIKADSNIRSTTRLINQQLDKGQKPYNRLMEKLEQERYDVEESRKEDPIYYDNVRLIKQRPITVGDYATPQEYLVKRAIEEKLTYLQNRKDSLAATPPIVLDEDKDFFRWYSDKRLVPIANRYQINLEDKNEEAKKIVADYTQKLNNNTVTQASKGEYTDRVINKLLNIEEKVERNIDEEERKANKFNGSQQKRFRRDQRPIKRVQRVVATELAIAYNVGRLKAYLKAGIQYVTISTSMYSPDVCDYCDKTAKQTEEEPIKISSLLKNAYKNQGFNKDIKPIISDLRYLPNHPHCYCFYKPHPKQDPEDKQESAGVYADPNSWKFILGAGLGVSLAFLAFALTTGRKISVPRTVPSALPVRVPKAIPQVVSDIQPQSIPVRAIPQSDLVSLPVLRQYIKNLSSEQQQDFADIITSSSMSQQEKIAALYTEAAAKGLNIEEKIGDIVDTIAQQIPLVKGVQRQFLQDQVAKIDNTFAIKSKLLLNNIDKQEQRLLSIIPDNPDKVTITSIRNVLRETDRKYIQNQLASIQKVEDLLLQSYKKTLGKTKPNDIEYRNELSENINKLQVYRQNLLEQQQRVKSIQQQLAGLKPLNKTQLRALVSDRIARVEAALDRDTQEASRLYNSLLEFLVSLPPEEANRYAAVVRRLRDKIEPTQYKRYTGGLVAFSSMNPKYTSTKSFL
jgi:hypothetical protein